MSLLKGRDQGSDIIHDKKYNWHVIISAVKSLMFRVAFTKEVNNE